MLITSGKYPPDWTQIARSIKKAAGWKCERCSKGHNLKANRMMTVHHLDGDKSNCHDYNLACLCRRCHLQLHHLFSPRRITFFPAATWLQKHIDASPWACTPAPPPGAIMLPPRVPTDPPGMDRDPLETYR